jgi:phosphate transport system substrate-binding protein
MSMKFSRVFALLAILALIVAACGGDAEGSDTAEASDTTEAAEETETTEAMDEETATTEEMTDNGGDGEMSQWGLPIIDPLDVDPSVTVNIAGSSTVFPLSTAVMTQWIDEGGPDYPIDSIGSGGGFERFCEQGESDISNASRPIDEEETASCKETWGGAPIEIRVGTDALSVVISQGNTFATEMSVEEIATAFSLADSGATWADVNADFPAHPIALFSPGADSGTFDYFNEAIFDEADPPPILSSIANIVGEDDNVTVQGVAEDGCTEGDTSTTCAIGYFGYAYYSENQDVLQAVAVDAGDGPVAPSAETVDDNSYPLSRPLFMYTADAVIAEKPQVADFIAYYLNNVNDLIGDVGYFPAPDAALQTAADAIAGAAGF